MSVATEQKNTEEKLADFAVGVITNALRFEGCACGEGDIAGTHIKTHCHRTNDDHCHCKFSGVHYRGQRWVAEGVATYIELAYWTDVDIVEVEDDDAT